MQAVHSLGDLYQLHLQQQRDRVACKALLLCKRGPAMGLPLEISFSAASMLDAGVFMPTTAEACHPEPMLCCQIFQAWALHGCRESRYFTTWKRPRQVVDFRLPLEIQELTGVPRPCCGCQATRSQAAWEDFGLGWIY